MAHTSDPKTNGVVALKRLGFFGTVTKKMLSIVGRMYTFGKENAGPFRHPVNAVERRVAVYVGPLYLKMENIAYQILSSADKTVDETLVKICNNVPRQPNETIYQVEETAPEEAKPCDVEETAAQEDKSCDVEETKPLNAYIEATESEPNNHRCEPEPEPEPEPELPEEKHWAVKAWHKLLQLLKTPQVIEALVSPAYVNLVRMLNSRVKKMGINGFNSASYLPMKKIRNLFRQSMTACGHKELVDERMITLNQQEIRTAVCLAKLTWVALERMLRKLFKGFNGFSGLPHKGKMVFQKSCFSFFGLVDFGYTITLYYPVSLIL